MATVQVIGDCSVVNYLFAKELRQTPSFHWAIPSKPYFFDLLRLPDGCQAIEDMALAIGKPAQNRQQEKYDKCAESFFRLFPRKKDGSQPAWYIDGEFQLTSHPQVRPSGRPIGVLHTEPLICMDMGLGWRQQFSGLTNELEKYFEKRPYLIRTHDPLWQEWRDLRLAVSKNDDLPGIWALLSEDLADGALRAPGTWEDYKRIIKDWLKDAEDPTIWNGTSWLHYLVIRIEYDGILILGPGDELRDGIMYIAPGSQPGSFLRAHRHHVTGSGTAYIVSFIDALVSGNCPNIPQASGPQAGIFVNTLLKCAKEGLSRSRQVLEEGYTLPPTIWALPKSNTGSLWDGTQHGSAYRILPASPHIDTSEFIKFEPIKGDEAAVQAIVYGDERSLREHLVLEIGELQITDTDFARDVLMLERRLKDHADHGNRILSFAILGQPGSGKSFVAKQLAKAIDPEGILLQDKTVNLSTFAGDPESLVEQFEEIEQITVGGKIPFVLWDEFDSVLDGHQCGWLRYFLMPMEDGKYWSRKKARDLGKCVFVFMGGTFANLKDFDEWRTKPVNTSLKGNDFHSRLDRVIQIPTCHIEGAPRFSATLADSAKLVRAQIIRHYLGTVTKVSRVEPRVITYLTHVPLQHGPRSLRRIIEASAVHRTDAFGLIHLPPKNVLELHTDVKQHASAADPPSFLKQISFSAQSHLAKSRELLWRAYRSGHVEEYALRAHREELARNRGLADLTFDDRERDLKNSGWSESRTNPNKLDILAKKCPRLDVYRALPPDQKSVYENKAKKAVDDALKEKEPKK